MAGARHTEVRETFHQRTLELLRAGCLRWQSKKEGWKRGETRPLKLAAFLRNIEDSAYQFFNSLERGTRDPERYILKTERAFEQFCTRLRSSGYYKSGEIENYENYFRADFWPFEREWIRKKARQEEIDVERRNIEAANGGKPDVWVDPDFADEWLRKIWSGYENNEYAKAELQAEAYLSGALAALKTIDDRDRLMEALERLSALVLSLGVLSLNFGNVDAVTRTAEFDAVASQAGLLEAQHKYSLTMFPLRSALPRYSSIQVDAVASLNRLLGSVACWQALDALRAEEHETLKRPILSLATRFAITEVARGRQELLALGFQAERLEAADLVPILRKKLFADSDEEVAGTAALALDCFRQPNNLMMTEMEKAREGIADLTTLGKSMMELSLARSALEEQHQDLSQSVEWLLRTRETLNHTQCLLAWGEFYMASATYMAKRGHPVGEWISLKSARELHGAAGNVAVIPGLEAQMHQRLMEPSVSRPERASTTEATLLDLLRETPPPIAGSKAKSR